MLIKASDENRHHNFCGRRRRRIVASSHNKQTPLRFAMDGTGRRARQSRQNLIFTALLVS